MPEIDHAADLSQDERFRNQWKFVDEIRDPHNHPLEDRIILTLLAACRIWNEPNDDPIAIDQPGLDKYCAVLWKNGKLAGNQNPYFGPY